MKAVYKRLIIILTIFLIVSLLSGVLIYRTYSRLNQQLVSRTALLLGRAVEDALRNTADKNLEHLTRREKKRLRTLMNSMTTESGSIIHILLINTRMKILLSSDRSIEGQQYKSSVELQKILSNQPLVQDKTWGNGQKVLDVILPLQNDRSEILGYLRLVLSYSEVTGLYKDLSLLFVPIMLLFALVLIFTFYFATRAYRTPLESIRNMASQIDKGDYSYRIEYSGNDEFTDTFRQLNKAIEKVGFLDESYKQASRRISTLLKAVDESVVVLDEDENVSSFNEAANAFFHTPADADFVTFFRNVYAENQELRALVRETRDSGMAVSNRELTLWLPDESEVFSRVSIQLYKEDERVTSFLLSFKDAYSLQELENNLQRSMMFGVIAGLASSISHEIKNPLSSMAMHTEVLSNRLGKLEWSEKEKVTRSLQVLQNEVKRLSRITNQFFNLARMKRTDLTLINLNAILNDVLFLVQQQTIERNIHLTSQLSDQIDFIYGDPDQLKQVFLNILLNAFQAIGKDGTVTVRSLQRNQRVVVEIEDTGAGMTEEVKQHIFDLYFTTKEDGGGIGLAVCRNIIHAHEGTIEFESERGKGTRFILEFPRKEKTTQLHIPAMK